MGDRRKSCVIGDPVAHSLSPIIHHYWLSFHNLDGSYERSHVTAKAFPVFLGRLKENGFVGANVTVPHKETAFDLVDRLHISAKGLGAVNTIWFEDGALVGANSDSTGFINNLRDVVPDTFSRCRTGLVVGAGGAARAVVSALVRSGIELITVTNRTQERAESLVDDLQIEGFQYTVVPWENRIAAVEMADLVVNTTTLGMDGHPPLDLPLSGSQAHTVVADIVYTPLETPLLRAAREKGLQTVDGLGMLLHQAAPGFEKWFGIEPTVTLGLRETVLGALRKR